MNTQLNQQVESSAFAAGQILEGRYELLLPVAQGGMGMVWIARLHGTRGFKKLVAVKTLLTKDQVFEERLESMMVREAHLIAKIHHQNVVTTFELSESDGGLFLAMEYISGETLNFVLARAIEKNELLPLDIGVNAVAQICRGLHAAHELQDEQGNTLGLVHRDVTPHNIMIGFDGVAKLIDFGIAKLGQGESLTQDGELKGKMSFMAPEQFTGAAIDRRVDIFSLGTTLYLITTGRHPFRAADMPKTVLRVMKEDPTPPSQLMENYPPELERIILKALQKNPDDRYQTAEEMAEDLEASVPLLIGNTRTMQEYVQLLLPDRIEEKKKLLDRAKEIGEVHTVSGVRNVLKTGTGSTRVTDVVPQEAVADPMKEVGRVLAMTMGVLVGAMSLVGGGVYLVMKKHNADKSRAAAVAAASASAAAEAPKKPKAMVGEYGTTVIYEGNSAPASSTSGSPSYGPPMPVRSATPRERHTPAPVRSGLMSVPLVPPRSIGAFEAYPEPSASPVAQDIMEVAPEPPPPPPATVVPAPAPPPPPKAVGPVRVSSRVGHAQLAINPSADGYRVTIPAALQRLGDMSTFVNVCVAKTGSVKSVSVQRSLGPAIDPRVVSTLSRWRYRPYLEKGEAVEFCYAFEYAIQN